MHHLLPPSLLIGMCGLAFGQPHAFGQVGAVEVCRGFGAAAGKPGPISLKDYEEYRGVYALGNGQTLYLNPEGRHLYAQVDDSGRSELLTATPGLFVTADGRIKVRFERGAADRAGQLLLAKTPQDGGGPAECLALVARG